MGTLRDRPYGRFNYLVSFSGADAAGVIAGFAEVSGLGVQIEYAEYRAGNDPTNAPRRIPGLHRVADVTLKRGVVGSTDLFEWLSRVSTGALDPRDVTITLLDEARQPVVRWHLQHAQPRRWSGPTLVASASGEVAIEELVLVAEALTME